jgi:hypothetical protein
MIKMENSYVWILFNDSDLMKLINHTFDWLVEQGFLNELHLN